MKPEPIGSETLDLVLHSFLLQCSSEADPGEGKSEPRQTGQPARGPKSSRLWPNHSAIASENGPYQGSLRV